MLAYCGVLIYAKLSPKLPIDSANGYYLYDSEGNIIEESSPDKFFTNPKKERAKQFLITFNYEN